MSMVENRDRQTLREGVCAPPPETPYLRSLQIRELVRKSANGTIPQAQADSKTLPCLPRLLLPLVVRARFCSAQG